MVQQHHTNHGGIVYVIRNYDGEFFSSKVEGEWGEGWGEDAQIFGAYEDASRAVLCMDGGELEWIRKVLLIRV